jgi:putative hydrolase of the HAD superfamily
MFEDMPNNLKVASDIGMTTVLVHSDYIDHPAQLKIREWRELPEYVHYLTRDLTGFLVSEAVPKGPHPR